MPDSAKPREPKAPAEIVVCADDYGGEPGTSAVIRGLIEARRINATTCLVQADGWKDEAHALRTSVHAARGAAVGLHLNLTEPLAGAAHAVAPISAHLARALVPTRREIDAAHAAFRAQWDAFVAGFGRAPDFIDGHEHVHLFPGPRAALLRLASEVGFHGWLRQCRTSSNRGNGKRLVLDPFSRGFERAARAAGFATNPGFGGLRHFDPREDMLALWREDLAAMTAGGLLMTHPGADGEDRAGGCRAREADLLARGRLGEVVAELGLTLAKHAAKAWAD
ncbi:MAG TPA: ChbG/HpnK family deacetylase [Caulobacteraceae bacterium]|nr:ChbG/HpnK family deacetylase [Caulobacteraceae bacterium]